MLNAPAYKEITDLIDGTRSPADILAFKPSKRMKLRVAQLLSRQKAGKLTDHEAAELDHYMRLEHQVRMAKLRAHKRLAAAK